MLIRTMTATEIPVCAQLAHRAYLAEKAVNPVLPHADASLFEPLLRDFSSPYAYLAQQNNEVIGFLCFTPAFDGAFGSCRGVFSPLHASAFFGEDPERTLTSLISAAMADLYRDGVTSVAVCRYAHEEQTLRALVLNGFGIRCSDLMARTSPVLPAQTDLDLRPMRPEDIPHVLTLFNSLEAHMASAPIFMPKSKWTEKKIASLGDHILVACSGGKPIAATILGHDGETYLDELPHVTHLGSTYCHTDFRGKGVMSALVQYASAHAHAQGFTHFGVDCETLNPPAFRFWKKHFEPFTYSAVRRLDERLLP